VPARTVEELVALIKAHPGKYSYASPGTGTPGHLVGEQFRLSLGLDLVHVPFNSAGWRLAPRSRAIRRFASRRHHRLRSRWLTVGCADSR
jgi:hypothetical protein